MKLDALFNRVKKNYRRLAPWAEGEGLDAWRIYDQDIPEHRYTVDWYAGRLQVVHRPGPRARGGGLRPPEEALRAGLSEALGVEPGHIFVKTKAPKVWGREQYERREREGARFEVNEYGLRFWARLDAYVDTGLFLDHRQTRRQVGAEAKGKRVLNLFAYTGAFTVHAAAGGARETTTVDMSNTYLAWCEDNLALNGLAGPQHRQVRADAVRWLRQARGEWDLVVLDPPSFSASKKMGVPFEVQRDHVDLLHHVRRLTAPGGVIYFSTHYRAFELDSEVVRGCQVEEITPASLPPDFRDRQIHRCFRLVTPRG